jgi:hypothetical protein
MFTVLLLGEKIREWLRAPDLSRNYNEAREKHTEGTGTWLTSGKVYKLWKACAGQLLWIHGNGELITYPNLQYISTADSGLWQNNTQVCHF